MKRLILAIVICLMATTAASAQRQCTALPVAIEQMQAVAGYVSHEVLTGDRALFARRFFAHHGGGSVDDWDTVMIKVYTFIVESNKVYP